MLTRVCLAEFVLSSKRVQGDERVRIKEKLIVEHNFSDKHKRVSIFQQSKKARAEVDLHNYRILTSLKSREKVEANRRKVGWKNQLCLTL